MRYYKFTNKASGTTGVLPKATIDKILGNAKQASTIEVLFECDADGKAIEEAEEGTAMDTDTTSKDNGEIEQKTEEGTGETKFIPNDWGGDDSAKRNGSEQSEYYY